MMKHFISTILPTMLLCMFGAKAYAYDIAVNNADGVTIYYNYINDDRDLEVTYLYDYDDYADDSGWNGFDDVYVGNVVIPEEVTYSDVTRKVRQIGECAFAGCTNLTSVTIPNSVRYIENQAFAGCTNLTSVTIPNSVMMIGNRAFELCRSLTSVTIPGFVKTIEYATFSRCSALTSITIPNGVTTIGPGAFGACTSLTSITIVTTIGPGAFGACTSLTSITIPEGVTSLESAAFSNCSSLTSITIPSTVTRIGMGVFGFMDLEYVVSLIQDPFDLSNDWVVPQFTSNTFENATLYVPVGTINKYKTKNGWKDFVHIKEGLPTGIKAPERKGVNELKRYDLSGRTVKNSSRGVNIIRMDDGTTKKVVVK